MRLGRTAVAVVAVIVALLAWAGTAPASAHAELDSSDPAQGATLTTPPTEITLTFGEVISDAGLQIVAQGPTGPVTLDAPVLQGPKVITPWPTTAPDGAYTISYRVVSADGHPIDGSVAFSYTGAAIAAPTPGAPSPSSSSTDGALGRGQSAAASPSPQPASASNNFSWGLPVIVVLGGVAIGAGIAYAMRSRRGK